MNIYTDSISISTIIEVFSAIVVIISSWVSLKFSVNKVATDTKKDITYLEDLIEKLALDIKDNKKQFDTEHEKLLLSLDNKETKIIHNFEIELKKLITDIEKDIESSKISYSKEIKNTSDQLNLLEKKILEKNSDITKRITNIEKICKELEISYLKITNSIDNIYKYDIPYLNKMLEKKDT